MGYTINLSLIKNTRIKNGITLEQMSNYLGLGSKADYFKRENGDTNFKSTELPIICDVLNIKLEKIFIKPLRKSKLVKRVN